MFTFEPVVDETDAAASDTNPIWVREGGKLSGSEASIAYRAAVKAFQLAGTSEAVAAATASIKAAAALSSTEAAAALKEAMALKEGGDIRLNRRFSDYDEVEWLIEAPPDSPMFEWVYPAGKHVEVTAAIKMVPSATSMVPSTGAGMMQDSEAAGETAVASCPWANTHNVTGGGSYAVPITNLQQKNLHVGKEQENLFRGTFTVDSTVEDGARGTDSRHGVAKWGVNALTMEIPEYKLRVHRATVVDRFPAISVRVRYDRTRVCDGYKWLRGSSELTLRVGTYRNCEADVSVAGFSTNATAASPLQPLQPLQPGQVNASGSGNSTDNSTNGTTNTQEDLVDSAVGYITAKIRQNKPLPPRLCRKLLSLRGQSPYLMAEIARLCPKVARACTVPPGGKAPPATCCAKVTPVERTMLKCLTHAAARAGVPDALAHLAVVGASAPGHYDNPLLDPSTFKAPPAAWAAAVRVSSQRFTQQLRLSMCRLGPTCGVQQCVSGRACVPSKVPSSAKNSSCETAAATMENRCPGAHMWHTSVDLFLAISKGTVASRVIENAPATVSGWECGVRTSLAVASGELRRMCLLEQQENPSAKWQGACAKAVGCLPQPPANQAPCPGHLLRASAAAAETEAAKVFAEQMAAETAAAAAVDPGNKALADTAAAAKDKAAGAKADADVAKATNDQATGKAASKVAPPGDSGVSDCSGGALWSFYSNMNSYRHSLSSGTCTVLAMAQTVAPELKVSLQLCAMWCSCVRSTTFAARL